MTVTKQLIDNVNKIKTTLNEISVYNLDVKTAIELYYELAKKVNEVINELSRFEGVVSEEVIKQNEKLIYLIGEGLKLQVGLKIDELIKDGTIQDLINNKIFNELNSKIELYKKQTDEQFNTKVNFSEMKYKYLENESLICVTYDNNAKRSYKLMITFDGVTFNKLDDLDLKGWDYCLAYNENNSYYYLSYDYMSDDFNPSQYPYTVGGNKIEILKTKDFSNFEKIDVNLPKFFKQTWGPEIIIKNNIIHLFFSGCDLTDTSEDIEGETQYIKNTYYTCSHDDGLNWSNPTKINLYNNENNIDNGNKIDPNIVEKNGKYYLFLKNEDKKYIEEYVSDAIDGDYKFVCDIKDRYFVEAPSVTYFNGKYYLYCDMYATGIYIYYTSTDLVNWGKSNILNISDNSIMRHFTCCKTYDSQLLKNIVKRNGYDPILDNYKLNDKFTVNYNIEILENKTYDNLSLKANTIYTLKGVENCVINKFDITNMKKGEKCYFFLSSDVAKLILKNNTEGVYLTSDEIVLSEENKCNNKLVEFVCVDIQPNLCILNHSDLSEFSLSNKTIFSNEYVDAATSVKANFIKRNKIVQGNFVCQLSKKMEVGLYKLSFKAPFLPVTDAYNMSFLGYNSNSDLQFRSVKIFYDGRIEIRTTTPIESGEYFECSVTYIEK